MVPSPPTPSLIKSWIRRYQLTQLWIKFTLFAEVFALMDWFFFFFFEGCIHPRYCAEAGRIGNNVSAFTVPVEHFYCSNFCGFSILILQIEIHSFQKSNLSYFHKLFPLLPLCLAEWLSSLPHVNLCGFEAGWVWKSIVLTMPHHPKNKHKFYIHWQLIRNSRLWIVSLFEEHSFWLFFQVLTQRTGHVPPCSWPAPCQQQLCHTSPGIRQE